MSTRVSVAIIRRAGKVLVCQRKKGARYELKWEFPGGKLEANETIIESLQRELREELSIELKAVSRIEFQTADYDDGGRFEVAYCFVSDHSGKETNNVFQEIRWVTLSELQALDILDGNRSFVARFSVGADL